MLAKSLRWILIVCVATGLVTWSQFPVHGMAQASLQSSLNKTYPWPNSPTDVIGTLFTQPVDPAGKLLISSWLDPDGSNHDKYVWDNFTLPVSGGITETITGIEWVGGYDPLRFGAGGAVIDFSVKIYPSTPSGAEPAIANPPLVSYLTGGFAGETSIGMVGTIPMNSYTSTLPVPLIASTGVKYWVQIQAFQHGSIPDWGIAVGTGGEGYHYVRESSAGGDIIYRTVTDDAAFTVLGPVPDTPTDIMISSYSVDENQPANTVIGELTAADPDPLATFTFSLGCAAPGPDDASFNIAGTNLRTSAVYNFEAKSAYHICIRVTDQNALTFDQNFVISVLNLNEAPTDITLSNNSVFEHLSANTVVGVLTAVDPDAGGSQTFSLGCAVPGTDDGSFNINGTSLRTSASI